MKYVTRVIDGREYRVKVCPPGNAIRGKPNIDIGYKILKRSLNRGELTPEQFRKKYRGLMR